MGSYIGGLMSVLTVSFLFSYLIVLISQMESGVIDQIKNTVMTNPIGDQGERNNLTLHDYTFLPVIEIKGLKYTGDVFKGNREDKIIDLEKFYSFITWTATQRNKKGKDN